MLEGLAERTRDPEKRARYEEELALPPLPKALDYLWRAFWRLSNRRGSNGFGLNPISWAEIDAFARNAGFALVPWEVEIIEELDGVFLSSQSGTPPKTED